MPIIKVACNNPNYKESDTEYDPFAKDGPIIFRSFMNKDNDPKKTEEFLNKLPDPKSAMVIEDFDESKKHAYMIKNKKLMVSKEREDKIKKKKDEEKDYQRMAMIEMDFIVAVLMDDVQQQMKLKDEYKILKSNKNGSSTFIKKEK